MFSPIALGGGSSNSVHRVEELRRQLNQNARAVSAVGFAPNCAAMGEIAQDRERIVDNGMQVASRGVCYHGYTTRIGFLIGVVQAPRFRYSRKTALGDLHADMQPTSASLSAHNRRSREQKR